jgi:hypothetical protein
MNRSTFSSMGAAAVLLLLSSLSVRAQSCAGELKPLKPLACQDAAPICLCDELGGNCRWIWSCTPSGYSPSNRRAVEPSQPARPAGGIDTSVYQMLRPPQSVGLASPSFFDALQAFENLRVQSQILQQMNSSPPAQPLLAQPKPAELKFYELIGLDPQLARAAYTGDPRDLPEEYPGDEQLKLFQAALKTKVQLLDEELERRRKASEPQAAVPTPKSFIPDGWQARVAAARQRYSDYDQVMTSPEAEQLLIPPAMRQAVFESEIGAGLFYWLVKHPQECRRIAGLSPVSAAREIGRIEERIVATSGMDIQKGLAPCPWCRENLGIIYMNTVDKRSVLDAIAGKRLTYARLIAKVSA